MSSRVLPTDPPHLHPSIGIIGMGEMGRLYAKQLSQAGWKSINVCDKPANYETLREDMKGVPGITVHPDGHAVSRISDWIMYAVEAEFIGIVVQEYGPSTKLDAVVSGQTSVKAPEREAFEKYLPEDVSIVSVHSLHGPTVSPAGQPLIIIQYRAPIGAVRLVEDILQPLGSRFVYMTYEEHDMITANTQAVTHAAFLSMGTAWHSSESYPWEHGIYVRGIETVKVNIMLRIYSNKWHVYAGLAILNPWARIQIDQYAKSATELFKLMVGGDSEAFRKRIYEARDKVFGSGDAVDRRRTPILLEEDILDQFSLYQGEGRPPHSPAPKGPPRSPTDSQNQAPANSHLALLAMVDCWAALNIRPFHHLDLAATPVFRMWIGVAEYLFRSTSRLDSAIDAAMNVLDYRSDDTEFVVAARGWSQCISFGSFELYRRRFEETSKFFESRFTEATKKGSLMIKAISEASAAAAAAQSDGSGITQ